MSGQRGRCAAPNPTKSKEDEMEDKDVILEAMRKAGEPLNAGKVAELTGLDRKRSTRPCGR